MSIGTNYYSGQNYIYPSIYPSFRANQQNAYSSAQSQPRYVYQDLPDTVEISSKKQSDNNQKQGMSKGAKWGIGILTTATALGIGFLCHKKFSKPTFETCQKNFSKILRRDVSKDETQKMLDKYKELLQIKDKDEFIEKTFEQVKKDYGYEDLNIIYKKVGNSRGENFAGGFNPIGNTKFKEIDGQSYIENMFGGVVELNETKSNKNILSTIFHEFQHCKQHEIAYRADKEKFLKAIEKARLSPEMTEEIKIMRDCIDNVYAPCWDKLPKLKEGTEEYKLATKYIDGIANYKNHTHGKEYLTQFVEKEAYKVNGMTDKISEYIEKCM